MGSLPTHSKPSISIPMRKLTATICLTIAVLIGSVGMSASAATNMGPSFDCDKASTATEKAICSSEMLSNLDRELAAAYKVARGNIDKESRNLTVLRNQQRQWVKKRSSTCSDNVQCLSRMYQERIKALLGDDVGQIKQAKREAASEGNIVEILVNVVWWLGIIIMGASVILCLMGFSHMPEKGNKDERFKTGYKDNIIPNPGNEGKAWGLILLSVVVLIAGFIIFGEGGGWDGATTKCKPGSTRMICK